jgi:hypothetical protein
MAAKRTVRSSRAAKGSAPAQGAAAVTRSQGRDAAPPSSQLLVQDAALELKHRRSARKNIIEFCTATHPHYQPNWHHKVIAEYLEKLESGELQDNLMVFAPPRHGKSELVAIRFPAWELGRHPDHHYIATAYGDELAATFSRACRNVITTPQYQRLWRHQLKTKNDTKWELVRKDDDQRASFISSGILSALTGEGATHLLIDDPVKNEEEAYSKKVRDKIDANYLTAASTRLAPNGKKVLIMTRWHTDDLAGRCLERAKKDKVADQWVVVVLAATNDDGRSSYVWNTRTGDKQYFNKYAALWPECYPRHELDRIKANLGSVYWTAMYQQQPVEASGQIFKRENWAYFDAIPELQYLVQVYDGACEEGQENNYSASITLGSTGTQYPILDSWRDKVNFPKLMAAVYDRWMACAKLYSRYPDKLVVENKSSGIQIAQQIEANNLTGVWTFPDGVTRRVPPVPVVRVPAAVSKVIRANGISGYHESKLIMLPRGAEWLSDFIDEHALFPKGINDDWVDCTVHGVTFYTRPTEDQEVATEYYQPITISQELDEFDYHNRNW